MKKKTQSILIVVLLAVTCVCLLAGCNPGKNNIDYIDHTTDDLKPVAKLVMVMHKWIGNYGWTIVVFTVFLKILMLPLDYWQRYSTRKMTLKMQKLQPLLDNIDKRYGQNTQRANEEKQKLYQKQGFSALSSCLPMIVTMVVFFVMFGGLRAYSTHLDLQTYQELSETYYQQSLQQIQTNFADSTITLDEGYLPTGYTVGDQVVFSTAYPAPNIAEQDESSSQKKARLSATALYVETAQHYFNNYNTVVLPQVKQAVAEKFEYLRDTSLGWLWIQNVSQPDTWASVMPTYNDSTKMYANFVKMENVPSAQETYQVLQDAVNSTSRHGNNGKWNGLMILPFLSIVLSFGSMWISQRMERKTKNGTVVAQDQQQATTNKTMMIIMPLMMAFFGFQYTGAFAIYMVVNYFIGIISTIALRAPVEKRLIKEMERESSSEKSKASYMR